VEINTGKVNILFCLIGRGW